MTALPDVIATKAPKARAKSRKKAPPPPVSLTGLIEKVLDDAKAEDIVTFDLAGRSSLADAMIVATGRSDRHVGAVADQVINALKDNGIPGIRSEGMQTCEWVLIDAGDVIVHVFKPEARSFYNLERLWGPERPKEPAES